MQLAFATPGVASDLRILVVDDEPDAREYIARILQEQGAEVSVAASAQEAWALLTAPGSSWHLLVSDIGMPGASGYDLLARIRGELGHRCPHAARHCLDRLRTRRRRAQVP